ncbi:MAG TPA: hypothetical protein VFT66_09675 [Roseiflexaceae bacterium]|nr:hypothetical protein [Roseiflexaceae bacterium]
MPLFDETYHAANDLVGGDRTARLDQVDIDTFWLPVFERLAHGCSFPGDRLSVST